MPHLHRRYLASVAVYHSLHPGVLVRLDCWLWPERDYLDLDLGTGVSESPSESSLQ